MSVYPDAPDDFVEWLEQNGRQTSPDGFGTRGDYGLYLRDRPQRSYATETGVQELISSGRRRRAASIAGRRVLSSISTMAPS